MPTIKTYIVSDTSDLLKVWSVLHIANLTHNFASMFSG